MPSVEVSSSGNAPSTTQNKKSAMKKLDQYLTRHENKYLVWKHLSAEQGRILFCTGIREYELLATFLANECVPKKPDDNDDYAKAQMAMGTAVTYYGIIIVTVKSKYGEGSICWKSTDFVDKVAKLRRNIKVVVIRYCIKHNIALWKKAPAIGRDGVIAIVDSYLRCGKCTVCAFTYLGTYSSIA